MINFIICNERYPMKNKEIMEKEIDLLQACINRMAQNSFLIKGWMISLVAVIIALLPEKVGVDIRVLCVVAFVVTICFWYLDAFFFAWKRYTDGNIHG